MFTTDKVRDLMSGPQPLQRLGALALVGLGWLLSPLCWWNDLLFNLPLAVGCGKVVSLIRADWFVPGLVTGYWLSNVVGIVLMQTGALGLLPGEHPSNRRRELLVGLATSTVYTVAVLALVKLGWLQTPAFLLAGTNAGHGSAA